MFLGSNPHSKGEAFSRSRIVFLENRVESKIKRDLIVTAIINANNKSLIA